MELKYQQKSYTSDTPDTIFRSRISASGLPGCDSAIARGSSKGTGIISGVVANVADGKPLYDAAWMHKAPSPAQ